MKDFSFKGIIKSTISMSGWTFLTVSFRSLMVLSVNKLTAVSFGAAGIAILSHFQNLIAIFTQINDQGNSLGIIREVNRSKPSDSGKIIATTGIINLFTYLVILTIFLSFSGFFTRQFQIGGFRISWIIAFAVSVFFILLNSINLALLYAHRAFKLLTVLTGINFIIVVTSFSLSLRMESLAISVIAFSCGYALNGIINFIFLKWKGFYPEIRLRPDRIFYKNLGKFFVMAGAIMVFGKFTDFFVRDFAISWYGIESTGFWQAQVKISESYRAIYQGILGVVAYSTMSKLMSKPDQLAIYVKKFMFISVCIVLGCLIILWLLRFEVINLLFSRSLEPAATFIHYQLIADIFALGSIPLVFLLALRSEMTKFISVHFLSALLYVSFIIVFSALGDMNVEALPIANMIRMIVFFIILVVLNRQIFRKHE